MSATDTANLKQISWEEPFIREFSASNKEAGAKPTYRKIFDFISERQKFLLPPMRFLLGASKEILASKDSDILARNALEVKIDITLRKLADPQLIVPMETMAPEYIVLVPAERSDPLPVLDDLFPVLDMDDAISASLLGRRGIIHGPQTEQMRFVHTVLLGTLVKLIENDSVINAVRPLKEFRYLHEDEQAIPRPN